MDQQKSVVESLPSGIVITGVTDEKSSTWILEDKDSKYWQDSLSKPDDHKHYRDEVLNMLVPHSQEGGMDIWDICHLLSTAPT